MHKNTLHRNVRLQTLQPEDEKDLRALLECYQGELPAKTREIIWNLHALLIQHELGRNPNGLNLIHTHKLLGTPVLRLVVQEKPERTNNDID